MKRMKRRRRRRWKMGDGGWEEDENEGKHDGGEKQSQNTVEILKAEEHLK